MAPVPPEGSQDSVRNASEPTQAPPDETDQRFPRSRRLIKGSEFRNVLKRGARVSGDHLSLHLLRTELTSSRLGLAVPRAVGNAVVRNRLKRRLRELFRTRYRSALDENPGPSDLVVRARPGAGQLKQAELAVEIDELLRRLASRRDGRTKRNGKPSS